MPLGSRRSIAPAAVESLFESLPPRSRHALGRLFDEVVLGADAVLVHAGDPSRWASVVVDGELAAGSQFAPARTVRRGEWIGLHDALGHRPATETVWCRRPTTILTLGVRELQWALDEVPGFAASVVRTLPDVRWAWTGRAA